MIMDKKRETQKKMKIDFKNSFFYLHAFLLEDFLSVSCHRIAEQLLYICTYFTATFVIYNVL